MREISRTRPVLLGTVALDVLRGASLCGGEPSTISIRWGGVMSNMACALGVLHASPILVSAAYEGEMHEAASGHLHGNCVTWVQLDIDVPMPLFQARLADGTVADEHFIGTDAFDVMTPAMLESRRGLLATASAISTCTDLPVETLVTLSELAAEVKIPYWVLVADVTGAVHLRDIEPKPSCVALNVSELGAWASAELGAPSDIADVLGELLPARCRALVTLGAAGSLLVTGGETAILYQPTARLPEGISSVGAGDVMFGSLLAARLGGDDWSAALAIATARTASYLGASPKDKRPYRLLRTPRDVPSGWSFSSDDSTNERIQAAFDLGRRG
jgi:ribokinase